METINVHVWHDASGKIIAVGRPLGPMDGKITPIHRDDGHGVLALNVPARIAATLHETHTINIADASLVARGEHEKTGD
jgi:hypothetical protein